MQQHQQQQAPPGMTSQPPPVPQQQAPQQQLYNLKSKSDQVPVACPICNSTLLNGIHFQRHAADKHFFERLKADLPSVAP